MVARINTVAFHGVDVQNVDVQVQISTGLPAFTSVGYIILLFLLLFFSLPVPASAKKSSNINQSTSPPSHCLSKTEQRNELDYHYSQDFSEPSSAVDRAGWTWVNRPDFDGDYDFIRSPQKDKITQLPKLYAKACSTKKEFLGDCQRVGSMFSASTGVSFIDGYKANLIGLPIVESYAIFGEMVMPIPSGGAKAARYRGDIPSKNLAALRGSNDELLIFDGTKFHSFRLEKAVPRKDGYPSWAVESDPVTKRDFVKSSGLLGTAPFLYEISDGIKFDEMDLDKNIIGGPFRIFTIAGDKQSWLIERDGIYAGVGKAFRRVAHRSPIAFITAPAHIGLTDDGNIYLQLQMDKNERVQPYLLQRTSEACDIFIDLNKDIELYFAD